MIYQIKLQRFTCHSTVMHSAKYHFTINKNVKLTKQYTDEIVSI